MLRVLEGMIDESGRIRLLEPVEVQAPRRVLVIILEDKPQLHVPETALLSEQALGEDWNRPEENEAWSHLQQVP